MIETVTPADATFDDTPLQVMDEKIGGGDILECGEYFGNARELRRGPQVFYRRFGPDFVINPHFHLVDQFQVVVKGSATIGKHPFDPVTVHYADSSTPYGPIVCGPEGMAFYNFRATADVGVHAMPGSSDEMPRLAGRSLSGDAKLSLDAQPTGVTSRTVIPAAADGLLALEVLAGPNEVLPDEIVRGIGRFVLVLEGSISRDGRSLPADSCIYASPGEVLVGMKAEESGTHVLHLQLPAP